MKKQLLLLLLAGLVLPLGAAQMPDNAYFNAMKDEMARTLKNLHRPGMAKPFYVAYKLENIHQAPQVTASLGELLPKQTQDAQLNVYAVLNIGTEQEDSFGYAHDSYWADYAYHPTGAAAVAKNYAGIRQALWQATDEAYIFATEVYKQKQAYKRLKQLPHNHPDFMPVKQSSFVEEILPFQTPDTATLQTWAQELSALGATVSYLEEFKISFAPTRKDVYFLNSLGGFYQLARPAVRVEWVAQLRNKGGYKKEFTQQLWLTELNADNKTLLNQKTEEFLQDLKEAHAAPKADTYIGPVLLGPAAAGRFLQRVLVQNMQNVNPLLSARTETDKTAGTLRNKQGLRVLSNLIDIYDRPQARSFNGKPLGGFMPIDDEGVSAQELALISGGKLLELPRTSRPLDDKISSNGHARLTILSLPRERLTNVFAEAKKPQSAAKLEKTLLTKCRELELEFCYILDSFPIKKDTARLTTAQRIYSKDGHKETVYGLKINNLTTRALRDIIAAGDDSEVSYFHLTEHDYPPALPEQSVVAPSLLLEELELVPDEAKPDKPPFVKKP